MALSRRFTRRSPQRRIYLIGVAGHPNFGDEAITRGWLRWLAEHEPRAQVWLDVPNASGATSLHYAAHPNLVCVDTIHRLTWEAGSDDPSAVVEHVRTMLDQPWCAPRWRAGIEAFADADVVHLLGGGYISANHPATIGLVAAAHWAHDRREARVGGTGLGLAPAVDIASDLWAEVAPAFDVLTVRDDASAAIVGPAAARSQDDIFLGGAHQHLLGDDRPLPDVMVLAQGDMHGRFDELCRQVRRVLAAWDVDDAELGFAECNPPVDYWLVDALRDEYPTARFFDLPEVMAHGLPARAGQRWLTTRYHPHLLASIAGASGVAIAVSDDYYGVKHQAVTAAGAAWPVIGLDDDPVEPGPAGDLPTMAPRHAATVGASADQLYR